MVYLIEVQVYSLAMDTVGELAETSPLQLQDQIAFCMSILVRLHF